MINLHFCHYAYMTITHRASTVALSLARLEFAKFRTAKNKALSKRLSQNVVPNTRLQRGFCMGTTQS